MSLEIRCSNCGKTFTPAPSDEELVMRLRGLGAKLAMVECGMCGHATDCNPCQVLPGDEQRESPQRGPELRCPVMGCTGCVSEVDADTADSFWGCGECGNVWRSRAALSKAVTEIVKKFPYRKVCYVRHGHRWDPAPPEEEPADYEDTVERENTRHRKG